MTLTRRLRGKIGTLWAVRIRKKSIASRIITKNLEFLSLTYPPIGYAIGSFKICRTHSSKWQIGYTGGISCSFP